MSLFGKILAMLNLFALGAFGWFYVQLYQKKYEWNYAAFRWELALEGLPMDDTEMDQRFKSRLSNFSEALYDELLIIDPKAREQFKKIQKGESITGDEHPDLWLCYVRNQEKFYDGLIEQVLQRLDNDKARSELAGGKLGKLADMLLTLAISAREREILRDPLSGPNAERSFKEAVLAAVQNRLEVTKAAVPVAKGRIQPLQQAIEAAKTRAKNPGPNEDKQMLEGRVVDLEVDLEGLKATIEHLDKVRVPALTALQETIKPLSAYDAGLAVLKDHLEDVKQVQNRKLKKTAYARMAVTLFDVLPTTEESKAREADDLLKVEARDPGKVVAYRRLMNVLGVRMMGPSLRYRAELLEDMIPDVVAAREVERQTFAAEHDRLINQLLRRSHDLQDEKDKLTVVTDQKNRQVELANLQTEEVKKRQTILETRRTETTKALEQLDRKQKQLFEVRVLLRDANKVNQQMEEAIRRLEPLRNLQLDP